MNYLAHLLLAGPGDAALLGAFLGDFVKGSDAATYPPEVAREIAVHRRVDAVTDAHPHVLAARTRFDPARRRVAGIALDVFHDHLLARDWAQHGPATLEDFCRQVYVALERQACLMPEPARHAAQRMAEQDWLGAYAHPDSVPRVLSGIARRLSRGGDRLVASIADLRMQESTLAAGFPGLLADLEQAAARHRACLETDLRVPAARFQS